MLLRRRLLAGMSAALKHLLFSVLVAAAVAGLVFCVWYPSPYDELAGGQTLFWLVIGVDMVCGPLLTLVIFNPAKPRAELVRDIGFVVLIQLTALVYGLNSVAQARPVWLAFEGNRFRVVSVPDLADQKLDEAPADLRQLSWTGPKPLGVQLADPTDPGYTQSILQSLEGLHPAFRPSRWRPYDEMVSELRKVLLPIDQLFTKEPAKEALIREGLKGLKLDELGYLPLESESLSEWVVVINRNTARPVRFLPVDGY